MDGFLINLKPIFRNILRRQGVEVEKLVDCVGDDSILHDTFNNIDPKVVTKQTHQNFEPIQSMESIRDSGHLPPNVYSGVSLMAYILSRSLPREDFHLCISMEPKEDEPNHDSLSS